MQKNCETCWIQNKNLDGVINLPSSSRFMHTKRKKIITERIKKSVSRRKTSAGERELKRKLSPGKQRRRVEGGRAAGSCPAQSTSDHCNRAGAFNLLSPKEDRKKNLVRQKNNNM
jgi:hypothetical protein